MPNDTWNPVSRRRLLGGSALALALAAGALTVGAADPALAQQQLKFAHVYETSEPYHEWALWAADEIEARTDGRYTMEVFPASSLGKEVDINEGLTLGTVDVIYTGNLFAGSSYGPIAIAGAPYMFRETSTKTGKEPTLKKRTCSTKCCRRAYNRLSPANSPVDDLHGERHDDPRTNQINTRKTWTAS